MRKETYENNLRNEKSSFPTNNKVEIFFRTRNSCIVNVPKNLKNKREIRDFIIDKIVSDNFENFVDKIAAAMRTNSVRI